MVCPPSESLPDLLPSFFVFELAIVTCLVADGFLEIGGACFLPDPVGLKKLSSFSESSSSSLFGWGFFACCLRFDYF
jgi:hypothetical protein